MFVNCNIHSEKYTQKVQSSGFSQDKHPRKLGQEGTSSLRLLRALGLCYPLCHLDIQSDHSLTFLKVTVVPKHVSPNSKLPFYLILKSIHVGCLLWCVAFFHGILSFWNSLVLLHMAVVSPSSLLYNISLYNIVCIIHFSPTFVSFPFGANMVVCLWTFLRTSLGAHAHAFLLVLRLRVECGVTGREVVQPNRQCTVGGHIFHCRVERDTATSLAGESLVFSVLTSTWSHHWA